MEVEMEAVSGSFEVEGAGVSLALLIVGGVMLDRLLATAGSVVASLATGGEEPGMFFGVGRVYTNIVSKI